jgi:hypothetical protein
VALGRRRYGYRRLAAARYGIPKEELMTKSLLVVIWKLALAMIAFCDAELWHLLVWPYRHLFAELDERAIAALDGQKY